MDTSLSNSSKSCADIIAGLTCGRSGCKCEIAVQHGVGLVHCPVDDNHWLCVSEAQGGKALIRCQDLCPQDQVINALQERGLRDDGSSTGQGSSDTSPYLTAALEGEAAGLSMFPPRQDGSKRPDTNSWTSFHTPNPKTDKVKRLTQDKLRAKYAIGRTGVGAFMGTVSGNVELFEFDDADTYDAFLKEANESGLGELVARIRTGYEETTPNYGVHWLYRCSQVNGNTKLAQRLKLPGEMRDPSDRVKTTIETRGNGGYAILAPSSGQVHLTGKPYVLKTGGLNTIATITPEERDDLWDLARFFDQMPVKEPHTTTKPDGVIGDRPGDRYNQQKTWPEVLEPKGWTHVYDKNGVGYWRRPGKDHGVSATTNYTGRDTLIVFSTSTTFETKPKSYDKFAAYAVLNHEGDFTEAAKALNALISLISYPDDTAWPILHPDAFYGLAGDIVKAIEPHTEADPVTLLMNILLSFGSLAGRGAHAEVEGDSHFMNESAVAVGDTSKARKDTGRGRIRQVFEPLDSVWSTDGQLSGLSSGEGLIYAVRDEILGMKQGTFQVVDPGVQDKRVLVTESEFASVLKVATREGNTLSGLLRQAWDHGNLRTMTRNSPLRSTDAHVSIIGHVTKTELRKYLTETESANGFANRFLWVCARRSKLLPEGGGHPDLSAHSDRLANAIAFAQEYREIQRDDDARALWATVYPKLSGGQLGLYGAVTSRAEAHVLRLSVIYAALDQSEWVRVPHLRAALAVWSYCDASARYIFGDTTGDETADKILTALRNAPDGFTDTDLHKLFSNNLQKEQIKAALGMLLNLGRVHREQTAPHGRTVELWRSSAYEFNEFNQLADARYGLIPESSADSADESSSDGSVPIGRDDIPDDIIVNLETYRITRADTFGSQSTPDDRKEQNG